MPRRRLVFLASNSSGARPSAIDLTSPPTQRAARALQEYRADLVILRRAPRRFDQPQRHVRIERVSPVGTVHGDGEQALVRSGARCRWT